MFVLHFLGMIFTLISLILNCSIDEWIFIKMLSYPIISLFTLIEFILSFIDSLFIIISLRLVGLVVELISILIIRFGSVILSAILILLLYGYGPMQYLISLSMRNSSFCSPKLN